MLLLHRLNARNPGRDDILSRLAYALQVAEKPDSAVVYYRQAMHKDTTFEIMGDGDMPSMKGAHSSGNQLFKMTKKGDYLLPVNVV